MGYHFGDYDAKRSCGISGVDPGAVPGGSTISRMANNQFSFYDGAETGSTHVVKTFGGVRDSSFDTGLSIINANDNQVVANDNFAVREAIAA